MHNHKHRMSTLLANTGKLTSGTTKRPLIPDLYGNLGCRQKFNTNVIKFIKSEKPAFLTAGVCEAGSMFVLCVCVYVCVSMCVCVNVCLNFKLYSNYTGFTRQLLLLLIN